MSDHITFFDKSRPDPTWAPHADEKENPGTLMEVPIEAARRWQEQSRRTIWQRWQGEDDGIQKPKISGAVDSGGNYVRVAQEGREILLTTDTVNDLLGLLVALRDEAIQIRRTKRAVQS